MSFKSNSKFDGDVLHVKSIYEQKKSFQWSAARNLKKALFVAVRNCGHTGDDFILNFRGHALHDKGSQRRIAIGTQVYRQQRRALAVLRLTCWSTAGQPLVNCLFCSSTGLHRILFVLACEETFRTDYPGGLKGLLPSEMSAPCFAQFCSAQPSAARCADPTCLLCVQVWDSTCGSDRIPLVHAFEELLERLFSRDFEVRGTIFSWAVSSVGIQFCPYPPGFFGGRADPTHK